MADIDAELLGAAGPPRGMVERALKKAKQGAGEEDSRVLKVIYLDEAGESVGEYATQQLPEDPFKGDMLDGLQEPPFPLEQLVFLAECHHIHGSALEQKVADVVGKGWQWEPVVEETSDDTGRKEMEGWFEGLAPDDSDMQEVLASFWNDYETVGWGLLELARDPSGKLRRVYHVPGHTVRAHKNGFALCQKRGEQKVWFRRWGSTDIAGVRVEVDAKTGRVGTDGATVRDKANDMFVLKKQSRRSSWYGIPGYITAVGWITLALAARDDNLMFFQNRREPRWAIVISGLTEDSNLVEDMRRAMVVDMKQPYRNMIIPVTGQAEVDFKKLSDTQKDGSFGNLSDRADRAIMVAHRVPAERLANADTGPLGGNNVSSSNRIYKDAVVSPLQTLCNKRINKLIAVEYEQAQGSAPRWKFRLDDLDISDEKEDMDITRDGFKSDLFTLREARKRIGLGPLMEPLTRDEDGNVPADASGNPIEELRESPLNDMLYTQIPGVSQYDDAAPLEGNEREDRDQANDEDKMAMEALRRYTGQAVRDVRDVLERLDAVEAAAANEYPA